MIKLELNRQGPWWCEEGNPLICVNRMFLLFPQIAGAQKIRLEIRETNPKKKGWARVRLGVTHVQHRPVSPIKDCSIRISAILNSLFVRAYELGLFQNQILWVRATPL